MLYRTFSYFTYILGWGKNSLNHISSYKKYKNTTFIFAVLAAFFALNSVYGADIFVRKLINGRTTEEPLAFDITPAAFDFIDQTGQPISTLVVSNTVTITGLEVPTSASVAGDAAFTPQISINGGPWVASGTISSAQTLRVRLLSPAGFSQSATVQVTVGDVVVDWIVATDTTDVIPDTIIFTDLIAQSPATQVTSNNVTLTGFDGTLNVEPQVNSAPISISKDNGTNWISCTNASVCTTVTSGNTLRLRMTTSNAFATSVTARIKIGPVSTYNWNATTRIQDTTPDAFSFTALSGASQNTSYESDTITLAGFDGPIAASISGHASTEVRVNGGGWTNSAPSVSAGDTIQLRVTSASSVNSAVTGTITVGTTSSSYQVTTAITGAVNFNAYLFAPLSSQVMSELRPLPTTTSTTSISIANTCGAQYQVVSLAGEGAPTAWGNATTTNVSTADRFLSLRLTTPGTSATTCNVTVTVGGAASVWTVRTVNTNTHVALDQVKYFIAYWNNGRGLNDSLQFPSGGRADFPTGTTPFSVYGGSESLRRDAARKICVFAGYANIYVNHRVESVYGDGRTLTGLPGTGNDLWWWTSTNALDYTMGVSNGGAYYAQINKVACEILGSTAIAFNNVTGNTGVQQITSNSTTIFGVYASGTLSVSASAACNGGVGVSVNGGAFSTTASLNSGNDVRLRVNSGGAGQTCNVTLTLTDSDNPNPALRSRVVGWSIQ